MSQAVTEQIRQETSGLSIARTHLSLWTDRGVADTSCALHSVGMAYWNIMGTMLGYEAIPEMPAPPSGRYGFVGDDVRNDSAWFASSADMPTVLVEFERYSGTTDEGKLIGKMDRLILAHHRWQKAPVLVLAYWTKGLASLPDHSLLRQRARLGFETTARERVNGVMDCQVLLFQMILQSAESRWTLSQVIERGMP